MDRADDRSEPTGVPATAAEPGSDVVPSTVTPPHRNDEEGKTAPLAVADGQPANTSFAADALDVLGASDGVVWHSPPRPLTPRAFSQFEAVPPVEDWQPVHAVATPHDFGGDAPSEAPLTRTFRAPSVARTLREPTLSFGISAEQPLSVDAALSEIDADVATRLAEPAVPIFDRSEVGEEPSVFRTIRPLDHTLTFPAAVAAAAPGLGTLSADPLVQPDRPAAKIKAPRSPGRAGPVRRAFRIAGLIAGGWLVLVLLLIVAYRFVNPPASALMIQRWAFGQDIRHEWVDFRDMSPHIVRAVLVSEDARFCEHNGIDFEAIEDAVEQVGTGRMRGASTISMQVVKNLFLWPSKSYVRKAIELPLTYVLEIVWPKRRIMEVYLNIAEWGPGIFGIGTASQVYFKKRAKNLSEREAARLAVALPNPLVRNAGRPGPGTRRLAGAVQVRMGLAPSRETACVLPKRRM